jgi:hypothetical protein
LNTGTSEFPYNADLLGIKRKGEEGEEEEKKGGVFRDGR